MKRLSKIDKAVQGYLDTINVKYSATYNGEADWCSRTADKFSVAFTKNKVNATFDFYRGVGHREERKNNYRLTKYVAVFRKLINQQVMYPIDSGAVCVFVPTSAEVLYCLLLDAESGRYTFPEFCQNYGLDEDSRKALDTYLVCQNTSKKLNTIFKHNEITHLQTLLEDY